MPTSDFMSDVMEYILGNLDGVKYDIGEDTYNGTIDNTEISETGDVVVDFSIGQNNPAEIKNIVLYSGATPWFRFGKVIKINQRSNASCRVRIYFTQE